MKNRLWLDCDGVLANFDKGFKELFGFECVREDWPNEDEMWKKINNHGSFFYDLEPMDDMYELLDFMLPYKPTIITGVSSINSNVAEQKTNWAKKYVGDNVPVITCRSKEKSLYCKPGDIIIDDWAKYRHLWLEKGGKWILHTSAQKSIKEFIDIKGHEVLL